MSSRQEIQREIDAEWARNAPRSAWRHMRHRPYAETENHTQDQQIETEETDLNKSITVNCDECKKKFLISKIEQAKLTGGAVLSYFSCPHCGKRYKVNVANAYMKKLIAQGKDMAKKKEYEKKLECRHKAEIEAILSMKAQDS